MKRTPLPRSTTPLQRKTPLRSKGHRIPRAVRQQVMDRANNRCEAKVAGVCTIRAEHCHHLVLRSQGGKDDAAVLMAICPSCHHYAHTHPAEAVRLGLIWQRKAAA